MMRLPDRPGLPALFAALGGGATTRPIGGVVRDTLLGLPINDIDLATRLTPEAVIECLEKAGIKAVPTGIAHGTVTAVLESGPVEITTLRRDVSTDGRHATVAFTDDWQEDAARRDFTINALSADPNSGEVFDYFGGLDDLKAGRVRFIGDPLQRIAEDHLRILRFFRFQARFGKGAPDADALSACAARANDLMALSRERIAAELLKLLDHATPVAAMQSMLVAGILKPVLPEIENADALARLVEREGQYDIAGNAIRRLAALIGPRPDCGRDIAARLKVSRLQGKRLVTACDWTAGWTTVPALAYRIGTDEARDRLLLADGSEMDFKALDSWERPVFPISGGALIARGLTPGPIVADTLRKIENAWIDADFPDGDAFETLVADAVSSAKPSHI